MNLSNSISDLPPRLVATSREMLGDQAGYAWLTGIATVIDQCEKQWHCTFAPPFSNLSINYVAPGTRDDGSDVVIKVCIPSPEYLTEVACLDHYNGDGALRLLARDDAKYTLLLERLIPGQSLAHHHDPQEALHIAASLMKRLWRCPQFPELFPSVDIWIRHMAERSPLVLAQNHSFPSTWILRALDYYAVLSRNHAEDVLLHGDLHMDNILSGSREPWLAIDPKGVIGPSIWETGPIILNALPKQKDASANRTVITAVVNQLASELNMPVDLIAAWGMVRAVLSAWWTVEDHGQNWQDGITVAEILTETAEAHKKQVHRTNTF